MKSPIQIAINTVVLVLLLFTLTWWSLFCFQRGYNLGHTGTDNPMVNWAISQFLLDAPKEEQ
ncbi:hypothetical protein SPB21_07225 [Leptothoe sp. ISB3NOV94-8A]